MNTMYRKRMQLSVMAVATLAIFAVAAVMLLAGGGSAQADTATPSPDGGGHSTQDRPNDMPPPPGPSPTPVPRTIATPEPCPGETGNTNTEAADVVDSGQIALFDVYWNPDEGELTNNPCPPTVAHDSTANSDTRSASNINIDETIIHIPSGAKINLTDIAIDGGTTTYAEMYSEVLTADNKEDRDTNDDGTPDGVGDGMVWALPACPPDGSPAADGLCISFSAALLNDADWNDSIVYHVDHVHQVDIDKQDPRYVLAYDAPAAGVTDANAPLWDSSDASDSKMPVAPGGYDRPVWFFTSRGTYEFQVHIQGNPDTSLDDPISKDDSVTSDMREYILHVGAEANLGITAMTVTPASPEPTDNVTITITASNVDGPDEAQETKVDVTLPKVNGKGLTYSSHTPTADTFADSDGDGVWTWDAGSLGIRRHEDPDHNDHGRYGNSPWGGFDRGCDDLRHGACEDHGDRGERGDRARREEGGDIPCGGAGPDSGQQYG